MNDDLVTVVIPVYKVERYLKDCIDSIINQTYQNLEIILIDDGSPDNCPKICDSYQKIDNRVKVIHKTNGGLSDARNKGIEVASGKWITFVDSDDLIHPNMIQDMLEKIGDDNSIAVVSCSYQIFNDNYTFDSLDISQCLKLSYDEYIDIPLNITAWGKLYKLNKFKEIRFPEGKLHEDEFTTWKLCYNERILFLPEKYYFYRQRTDSIMGVKKKKNFDDILEAYIERLNFFIHTNTIQYLYVCNSILNLYLSLFSNVYIGISISDRKYLEKIINTFDFSRFPMSQKFIIKMKIHFPRMVILLKKIRSKGI